MSITEPPSAFIRFCKARRPGLKVEHPGASFGELTQLLGAEWSALGPGPGPYVAAKAAEDEATATPAPQTISSCRVKSNEGSDWTCLPVPRALDLANEMYGTQAWADGWNSSSPGAQTTVAGAGQMAIDQFMASRFNRCWLCPACAINE